MKTDGFGLTRRDQLALDAAKLYYLNDESQQAVAEALHVSRPTVSKLLATARDRGFVRMLVVDPRESDRAVASALRDRYQLADLRLVLPVGRGPMDRQHALGSGAAALLSSFSAPDGDVVGFWWSSTIREVAEAMTRMRLRHLNLVQLNGNEPSARMDASLAAFAARAPMPVHTYSHPIVHPSVSERLEVEAASMDRRVLALRARCDVAVFDAEDFADSLQNCSSQVTEDERQQIETLAVGQICGRFIDGQGKIVAPSLSQRTMGPTLSDLRKIKRTILVAGGDAKLPVMRAVLENRYANHLVTDIDTALALAGTS